MKIAITGGTGFVGRHLARRLLSAGHQTILLSRGRDVRSSPAAPLIHADLSDVGLLTESFRGCDAIAHCAGINREIGLQTYQRIHVAGTTNVIEAARLAGVSRILLLSFLRARPHCGSPYHESKFQAEELIRQSGLDYTVLKAGMIYGRGDHMLDHFTEGRLSRQTVYVLGPESLLLSEAVRRVAGSVNRRVWILPSPVVFHRLLAAVFERTMVIPLVARSQVQMLAEGFLQAAPAADPLPHELKPQLAFTASQIRQGLPAPGPFTCADLRFSMCQHGR
jgi:NADH dehydrogenase